jgi:hypothetical protein
MNNASTILLETSEEKRQLEISGHSCKDNIKDDINERVFESVLDLNSFRREISSATS